MKNLPLLILLLPACLGYCQLPADSLKGICIQRYKNDILDGGNTYLKREIKNGNLTGDVKEAFKGYFDSIKVLLINHKEVKPQWIIDDDPNVYPRLYAFNQYTWLQADTKNYAAFNTLTNSAHKKITNLDKCYLYLFLNGAEPYSIIYTDAYRHRISSNSVFLAHMMSLFSSNCGTCQWPEPDIPRTAIENDIAQSDIKHIKVYSLQTLDKQRATYRYMFVFDKHDNITNVAFARITALAAE